MKKILLSVAIIATSFTTIAQVGVGTTDPKAGLDITSDKGMLLPRIADHTTLVPVDGTLDANEAGLQIYNTTTKTVMIWSGTAWSAANASGKFVDGTNAADAVFNTGANVGIKTDTPIAGATLDVRGRTNLMRSGNAGISDALTLRSSANYAVDRGVKMGLYVPNGAANNGRLGAEIGSANEDTDDSYLYFATESNGVVNETMRISSNGKMGIGTSVFDNNAKLQVNGNGRIQSTTSNFSTLAVASNSGLGAAILDLETRAGNPTNNLDVAKWQFAASGNLRTDAKKDRLDFDFFIGDGTTFTRNTVLSLDSNGNVGVGNTTKNAKLDVNGYIKLASSDATADTALTEGLLRYNSGLEYYDGSAWKSSQGYWQNTGTHTTLSNISNNVGIGTVTTIAKLDVRGTGSFMRTGNAGISETLNLRSSANYAVGRGVKMGLYVPNGSANNGRLGAEIGSANEDTDDSYLYFATESNGAISETLRISSNGNVGVGTTNPTAKLEVNGAIKIGSNTATPVAGMIQYGDPNSTGTNGFYGYDGAAWVKLN